MAVKSPVNERLSSVRRDRDRRRARIREHPGKTLEDLKRNLRLDVSVTTICKALQVLKVSIKNHSGPPGSPGQTS